MFAANEWVYTNGIKIPGRKASLDIAYIRRAANRASTAHYETGDMQTDFQRSSFQSLPATPLVGT